MMGPIQKVKEGRISLSRKIDFTDKPLKGINHMEKQQQLVPTALPPEIAGYLHLIENAASNPDVDVDKLQKLLEMQERILARRAEMAFSGAMSQVQSQTRSIAADALNPQTRSKYASYKALDKALRPIYTSNGFALSFNTEDSPLPEHMRVVCDVSHVEGVSRHYRIDMPTDGKGARGGDVMTKTHAVGAGASYGMRYLLKMIFNVAVGEDDQDGNDVSPSISEEQAATLQAMIEEVKADKDKFLKYMRVEKLSDLPAAKYASAVKALEKKRRAA